MVTKRKTTKRTTAKKSAKKSVVKALESEPRMTRRAQQLGTVDIVAVIDRELLSSVLHDTLMEKLNPIHDKLNALEMSVRNSNLGMLVSVTKSMEKTLHEQGIISAIKQLRARTGCSLYDAKHSIEAVRDGNLQPIDDAALTPQSWIDRAIGMTDVELFEANDATYEEIQRRGINRPPEKSE